MSLLSRITSGSSTLVKNIHVSQTGVVLGRYSNGAGKAQEIEIGEGLTLSGGTLSADALELTSGPVTSSNGVSAIADGALSIGKTSGLQTALDGKASSSHTHSLSNITQSGAFSKQVAMWSGGSWVPGVVSYLDLTDVPTSVPLTASKVVANAAARLALSAENAEGFAVVEADTGKSYILVEGGNPATSNDWTQIGDRDIQWADVGGTTAGIASAIAGSSSKTTPVDADEVAITDSAASGALKRLSWANIKATLKLYFDTLYITVSNLSTNGGADKVAQFDASAYLRMGAVNNTGANPGGGLRIPTYQRITWEDNAGSAVANVWMFHNHGSSHDANTYPELVWSSARHCYYWDDGFQMGNSTSGPGQRGWRFLYFNPLGQACAAGTSLGGTLDTQMESIATIFGSEMWDGAQRRTSYAAAQYVATGAGAGNLTFWTGGTATPGGTSARGRILSSSGYNNSLTLNNNGPIIPTGKTLQAESDLTVTQNGVVTIKSDLTGAVANTMRLGTGRVRVGGSQNLTGAPAVTFEVAPHIAGIAQTLGDFYVASDGTVYVGRQTATSGGGNSKLIVQGRTGIAQMTFDGGGSGTTPTATFVALVTSTNTTDATSSAGAIKTSGGISAAKGIYLGTVLTGTEQAAEPAAPAANGFVIYAIDNGGKTQLMVKFATGAAQQLAIEP